MNMNKPEILFTIFASIAIIMIAPQIANAQSSGFQSGATSGAASGAVTTTLGTSGSDTLSFLLTASGGNFGSKFGLVSVSVDKTNFILVDNISLSTGTKLGKFYDTGHLASTVAVNPAVYPFVKLETSAGNSGVTETVTWIATRVGQ